MLNFEGTKIKTQRSYFFYYPVQLCANCELNGQYRIHDESSQSKHNLRVK